MPVAVENNERRRRFELPRYRELTKEQENIRRLPPDGTYLITGGPGTGKSIVALIRAQDQKERFPNYRFLTYNVLLDKYCRQLLPEVQCTRFHAWFWRRFKELYGQSPPETDKFVYDWPSIKEIFYPNNELPTMNEEMLIIDEGQDLPPKFYEFLCDHQLKVFVVADENQQIFDENSNAEDIEQALEINRNNRLELRKNWRNSSAIARLAAEFYHNRHIPLPEPPEPDDEAMTPYIIEYQNFHRILESIVNIANNYKKDLIGVITPNDQSRHRYLKTIKDLVSEKRLSIPVHSYYAGQADIDIRFDVGSIVVINKQSCKGLEFDDVFIGDLNGFVVADGSDQHLKDFYVMTTRARKRLYFLRDINDKHCPMADILYQYVGTLLQIWRQPDGPRPF